MASDVHLRIPWWERPSKPYPTMSVEEKLQYYDAHNGNARVSNDLNLRLHGKCGCGFCSETRKLWTENVAPINDPSRKGSHAMGSINICDISGDLVNGAALGAVTLVTSADHRKAETIHKEICPQCVGALVSILETVTEQHSKRAHTKPWARPKDPNKPDNVRDIIRMVVEEVHGAKAIEAPRSEKDTAKDGMV